MRKATALIHAGRPARGPVNMPIMRASTILFETVSDYEATRNDRFSTLRYGLHGTETQFALEDALTQLEGCHRAIVVPSGLAAATVPLTALLKAGDHILIVDTVYGPVRNFAEGYLKNAGVSTTFYSPSVGEGIIDLIRPETRLIYAESPGSFTFEVQDIPSISKVAREKNIILMLDNTWATPLYFDALGHGVDITIQAATKYLCGHSDVMMGVIGTTDRYWKLLRDAVSDFGMCVSADDCFLALRGLRTLPVRLAQQQQSTKTVTEWLSRHPSIARVHYPALSNDPGHQLWTRDFTGASSLFGLELKTDAVGSSARFIDALKLFGIGASWGGFESLALPAKPVRSLDDAAVPDAFVRLYLGLEDPEDLIVDLDQALACANQI